MQPAPGRTRASSCLSSLPRLPLPNNRVRLRLAEPRVGCAGGVIQLSDKTFPNPRLRSVTDLDQQRSNLFQQLARTLAVALCCIYRAHSRQGTSEHTLTAQHAGIFLNQAGSAAKLGRMLLKMTFTPQQVPEPAGSQGQESLAVNVITGFE